MKRLRVILLFLLLGAIVTVMVAWACAVWVYTPPTKMRSAWVSLPGLRKVEGWNISRKEAFGATQLVAMVRSSRQDKSLGLDDVLPAWSNLKSQMNEAAKEARREADKPENANGERHISPPVLLQKAYGFPFRSMYWNWDSGSRRANPMPQNFLSNGMTLKPHTHNMRPSTFSLDHHRALPLLVLPFGFALNTVITALLLWLLFISLVKLRRTVRRRRGLCVTCAYDLRGAEHEACPECGQECPSS